MEPYFSALPWEMRSSHRVSQLLGIAEADPDERTRLRQRMDDYLRSHPTIAAWKGHRPRLRNTPHFAHYLTETKRSRYVEAIDALGAGTASASELELVRGLGMEIADSSLVVRSGQVLLTGSLRNRQLFDARHEQFLWATIHPVLAVENAISLRTTDERNLPPAVHVLHLERDLPALLGRRGSNPGYDLLLPRRLSMQAFASHESLSLTVREVLLGF